MQAIPKTTVTAMIPAIAFPTQRRPRRGGFTLIELLTVIAIIGILAAIIIPVVGKVRTTAKRTQGLSNLRQITLAGLTYAQDNRGRWFAKIGNSQIVDDFYVEKLSKYAFKGTGDDDHRPLIWQDPIINYTGKDMHFAALELYFGDGGILVPKFAPYNNLSNVKTPSRQVLFADNWADKEKSSDYGGVHPVINDVGTPYPATINATNGNLVPQPNGDFGTKSGNIDLERDPGQAKLGFLDGHVAIVKRKDLKHSLFDPRY